MRVVGCAVSIQSSTTIDSWSITIHVIYEVGQFWLMGSILILASIPDAAAGQV